MGQLCVQTDWTISPTVLKPLTYDVLQSLQDSLNILDILYQTDTIT
jgi:hypothetical protein